MYFVLYCPQAAPHTTKVKVKVKLKVKGKERKAKGMALLGSCDSHSIVGATILVVNLGHIVGAGEEIVRSGRRGEVATAMCLLSINKQSC